MVYILFRSADKGLLFVQLFSKQRPTLATQVLILFVFLEGFSILAFVLRRWLCGGKD